MSKTVSKKVKYFPVKHASFDIAENFLSSAMYTIFVSIIMDTQTEKVGLCKNWNNECHNKCTRNSEHDMSVIWCVLLYTPPYYYGVTLQKKLTHQAHESGGVFLRGTNRGKLGLVCAITVAITVSSRESFW